METVKVNKLELLAIIKENRANHRQVFLEALEGYKKKCIELLEQHLANLRTGKVYHVSIALPEPQEHTKDYDRVIRMLELSVDDVVEIAQDQFAQYVMDDWAWKNQFTSTTSMYRRA